MTTGVIGRAGAQTRRRAVSRRLAFALLGALAVAAAAQVALPIPGSPVPFTLQPMAVLIVGGLLGARYGALSMVMYLAMGAMGLPVFTPLGAPGFARLIGPTGGFLIAYPFAAAVVGWTRRRADAQTRGQTVFACLAGMTVIFAGGMAQLAILGLGVTQIITPFLAADLVKSLLAALVIQRFATTTRALR